MTNYEIAKLVERGVRTAPRVSTIDCQILDVILQTPDHLARTAGIIAMLGVEIPELLIAIARLAETGNAARENANNKQTHVLH